MNEIYGIDPNIEIDINDLSILLKSFGLSEGRFIGSYPENLWWSFLKDSIKRNSGFDESRLEILRKKSLDKTIPILQKYKIGKNTPKDWLEKASFIKANEKAFTEIFSVKSAFYDGPTFEDLIFGDEYDPSLSRGDHIASNPESYIKAIKPLLLKSSEVHFVDKYFVPWSDNHFRDKNRRLLIELLFKEAKKSNRCESIVFHLDIEHFLIDKKKFDKQIDPMLEQKFNDLIGVAKQHADFEELKTKVELYEKMTHGRYMFSIKGGLQFDSGFDAHKEDANHVHWLSKRELEPIFDAYGV